MRSLARVTFATLILSVIFQACSIVPLTGRKQLHLLPESQMLAMSFSSYSEFLNTNQVSGDRSATNMVNTVGKDIAAAVTRYFTTSNDAARLEGYQWEFNLVEDKTPNAWCMPGGKVVRRIND